MITLKPGLKQLFIDDRFFDEQDGICLSVNPPVVLPEPVLSGEEPWEKGWIGLYSTVWEDGGVYKMWYDTFGGQTGIEAQTPNGTDRSMAYATSDDGLHWQRENVNLYGCRDIMDNNIVLPGGSASVMIDPLGPPEHRYKGLGFVEPCKLWPGGQGRGVGRLQLNVFTSPDGIRWTRIAQPAVRRRTTSS